MPTYAAGTLPAQTTPPAPGSSGPTTPYGLPAVPGLDPVTQAARYRTFTQTWARRWPAYTSMGFSSQDLTPALRYDLAHLNTTGSLLPESHVAAIAVAAHTGKPYAPTKQPNIIQAARSDIGNLLRSIPNLPAELLVKEPARINAALGGRWSAQIESQSWLSDLKDMLSHPFFTAPAPDYKAEEASMRAQYGANWAAHVPGLRMIPGYTTTLSLLNPQGRGELLAHPVTTLLDVAPYLGKALGLAGELAVPESLSGVARYSVSPALRDIGVRPSTLGEMTRGFLDRPLQTLPYGGIGADTRELAKMVNTAQQQAGRAYTVGSQEMVDQLASSISDPVARREFIRNPAIAEEVFRQVQGTAPEQIPHLVRAFSDPTYSIPDAPPHIQAMAETMRDLARRAEWLGVKEGHLVRIEGVDPSVNGLVYSTDSPAGRAYTAFLARTKGAAGPGAVMSADALDEAQREALHTISRFAPAAYTPAVNSIAKALLGLRTASNEMLIGGSAEFDKVLSEVNASWRNLRAAGYDPPWIHETPTAGRRPFITPGKEADPAFIRNRTLAVNGSYIPQLQVAASDTVRQMVEAEYSRQVVDEITARHARPMADVLKAYTDRFEPGQGSQAQIALERRIAANWVPWKPGEYFGGRIFHHAGEDSALVIPRQVDQALKAMVPKAPSRLLSWSPLVKGVWVSSILSFSPAYLVHNLLGSMTMLLAGTGPSVLTYLDRAWEMARHEETLPEFSLGHMGLDLAGNNEAIAYWTGKTYGRILDTIQKASTPARSIVGFAERLYKSMAYLYGQDKALGAGMDEAGAREAGIRMADKVLHDFNTMTPIERNIVRHVFPFYGWMKTLWGFTLSYPFDHPLRIAIANNITRVTGQDRDHRLADLWDNLFQIGSPSGGPFGRVKVLDLTSINPFATAANMFTLSGLLSHFNPAISTALSIAGWVPATQQEMFPQLDYDPTTGRLVVQQQSLGQRALSALGVFPQLEAGLEALKLTDASRNQALADPAGWRQAWEQKLFNLPFKATPTGLESKDLGVTIAQGEEARVTVANKDVDAAVRNGDLGLLQSYFPRATAADLNQLRTLYYLPKLTGSGTSPTGLQMINLLKLAGRG